MAERVVEIKLEIRVKDVKTDRDDLYVWEAGLEHGLPNVIAEHLGVLRGQVEVVAEIDVQTEG